MASKVNYQIEMERELARIARRGERPRLALHACCAPCSSAVLERLRDAFELRVFYYNPNIAPEAEFAHRAAEEERLVREMGLTDAEVTVGSYDAGRWRELVRGHEADPEGGARCAICFEMRLRETARFAREIGADYFTTTLSISPLKDAQLLNAIGARVGEETGVRYLFSDFKKKDGYRRSIELSAQYNLYRQDYCGCAFSKRDREAQKSPYVRMISAMRPSPSATARRKRRETHKKRSARRRRREMREKRIARRRRREMRKMGRAKNNSRSRASDANRALPSRLLRLRLLQARGAESAKRTRSGA